MENISYIYYSYHPHTATCGLHPSDNSSTARGWWSLYIIIVLVISFYLPLGVLTYSYVHIFRIARWHTKRIAIMAAMVQVITLSVGVPMAHDQTSAAAAGGRRHDVTSGRRKTSRNVCTFIGAFIACYAPYCVTVSTLYACFINNMRNY